jgi:hypothetical protein
MIAKKLVVLPQACRGAEKGLPLVGTATLEIFDSDVPLSNG